MEERSGIAQYLIRPSPRYRMTQTTMTEARTSCRKVGFPLSFPRLPANPRSQPVHPTAAAGARNEGVPRCSRPCTAINWHHVVGMANDAENIIALYDRNAEAWDRERPHKLLERAWLERFLSLVALGGSVLDIGCGTAEPIGRFFIDGGYALTGIDASPAMIQICKRRFPNASWLVADMRTLALDKRFDGLLAWDSFLHLTPQDQRRMFPIFREHAAPS